MKATVTIKTADENINIDICETKRSGNGIMATRTIGELIADTLHGHANAIEQGTPTGVLLTLAHAVNYLRAMMGEDGMTELEKRFVDAVLDFLSGDPAGARVEAAERA